MKNKSLDIIFSIYLVLRYIAIISIVYLIVGIYSINSYGFIILIYYIAVNYLAIKYGIVKELDNRDYTKKGLFLLISLLVLIFNICFLYFKQFDLYEIFFISIVPLMEFYFIKTNKEKQKLNAIKTQKTIDEYFKNKK